MIRPPIGPLVEVTKRVNGNLVLLAPFSVVAVDLANGNITNVQYVPSIQSMIEDTPQSLTGNRLILMLLYTHRNGKQYISKSLYDANSKQLFPPPGETTGSQSPFTRTNQLPEVRFNTPIQQWGMPPVQRQTYGVFNPSQINLPTPM